jgi:glycosyltransferase involved in cell wall biosynthesis
MQTKIVGVLALKNVLSQGYPFLESIYSFLSFGDKLYISDGGSDDGTEEILKRISKNKKIKFYPKQKWIKQSKGGSAIGNAYNSLLSRVKSEIKDKQNVYIMEIQANEIIHEASYNSIKSLPVLYPQYRGYVLPFQMMVGPYLVDSAQWRLRIVPLKDDPVIMRDAVTIHPKKELSFTKFLYETGGLTLRYLKNNLYYFRNIRRSSYFYRITPLKNAIFRYTFIFPDSIIEKMAGHAKIYKDLKDYKSDNVSSIPNFINHISKRSLSTGKFYSLLAKKCCEAQIPPKETSSEPIYVNKKEHPKIMQGLIDKRKYIAREDIIKRIIQL